MAKILVGDFRANALQAFASKNDYAYLIEDGATSKWFKDLAATQLGTIVAENDSVVITIGFNDCVNCCTLEYSSIDDKATTLSNAINTLVSNNKNVKFYVCSVNPVNADYATCLSNEGFIVESELNAKIEQFNTKIKSICKATYLDTYTYLSNTSFSTVDGVRFTDKTCLCIFSYFNTHLESVGGLSFDARLKAPTVETYNIEVDSSWLSEAYGGLNPFGELGQANAKCLGDTLPNCTSYAWGRFYEILGSKPALYTGKVEQWYTYTSDGYQRGQEPRLGAIMCWSGNSAANIDGQGGNGHVAIVEKINSDGSIRTSESAFGDSRYWWTTDRSKGSDGNWGQTAAYTFQGFIYCPNVATVGTSGIVGDYVSKSQVVSKNAYLKQSEKEINARYIWNYLGSKGWTINAVAGLLGNLESESTLSPTLWQSRIEGSIINSDGTHSLNMSVLAGRSSGYGLVQWTPYSRYTNWCKSNGLNYWDIDSQLARIIYETQHPSEAWALPSYNRSYVFRGDSFYGFSFNDFITSTKDPGWLAACFAFCYEKPDASNNTLSDREKNAGYTSVDQTKKDLCETRARQAESWYTFLSGLPTIAITTVEKKHLKFENFKIDACSSTFVNASFLTSKAEKASYVLKKGNTTSAEKSISVKENFTSFKISDLAPNSAYKIALTVQGGGDTSKREVSFSTEQSFPESITAVKLSTDDTKLPYNNLNLSISPSSPDFGYWENNGNGYAVQLIVNGRLRSEREVSSLPKTIKLSDYFKYTAKLGDIIQIGIRTWVESNDGKIYDNDFAKVSNPICMLTKPVMTYLNK